MTSPRDAFVAVDLGGQSGRVVLGTFTDGGLQLAEVHRFANVPISVDGVLCWDAELLFAQTLDGLGMAVRLAAERDLQLAGIGVDSWGVDYGLVDASGTLIAPMRHHRAGESRHVVAANRSVATDEAYRRTGIIESTINTVFQLVRDAELGLLDGSPTVLLTADLWTYWLSGSRAAERTLASTTGLVDWTTGAWAADLMERWDIPAGVMPALVAPGTAAGLTTDEVTHRIGAARPVPVFHVASHDTADAFTAVADAGEPIAIISCGTWALVGCHASRPVLTDDAMRAGFTNEEGVGGSVVFVRNLSGTWLLEECLRTWLEEDGRSDLAALRDELLAGAACEPRRATCIDPGAAELLEPGGMPARIASLYASASGDDRPLARVQIVRVILDSLAASFADTISAASTLTSIPFHEVRMIGGGSRIELLVSLTEDATGLPVRIGAAEATSVGSICIQAVAAGTFPTLAEARRRT